MKKNLFAISLILSCVFAKAQEVSVEKNMFGVQLGLISVSLNNEAKLYRRLALHTEIGVALSAYTFKTYSDFNTVKDETGYLFSPFLSVEPRFYYGLDRRARRKKNTSRNSSNYFSIKSTYFANKLEISNSESNQKVAEAISIVPSYGIRRTFAKNFNYEFAFGIGYQHNIFNSKGCDCDKSEVATDLQAKVGYTF